VRRVPRNRCRGALETDLVSTSTSPASSEIASSVLVSPIPASTTLAPKSEKKPSAAVPQRARAWDRSCRQAIVTRP
jgi:hypothetical protein